MRGQSRELQRRDSAAVFQAPDDRFAINPGGSIQCKGKRNFFRRLQGHHRAERKAVLRKVAHHSAVRGRKLDVDKAQRPFSKLRPALGLQSHGSMY
jgi:hypothetical protein